MEGFRNAFDHPYNSLFEGDRIVCCATRWLTVAAALRRPNGSAIGALHAECSGERVGRRGSSLDGQGPKETSSWRSDLPYLKLMEGTYWMAAWANANSPLTMTMKSRSPKCTCVPGAQLVAWLAIRGLIWNVQRPLPGTPTISVSYKHRQVNLQ